MPDESVPPADGGDSNIEVFDEDELDIDALLDDSATPAQQPPDASSVFELHSCRWVAIRSHCRLLHRAAPQKKKEIKPSRIRHAQILLLLPPPPAPAATVMQSCVPLPAVSTNACAHGAALTCCCVALCARYSTTVRQI